MDVGMESSFGQACSTASDDRPFAAVFDREEFRRELRALTVAKLQWGSPQETRVKLLRPHAGRRHTFEVAVRTESGWHSLIVKLYSSDRPDVFRVMQTFQEAGFKEPAEFAIPRPLLHLPSLGARLEEKISGVSAEDIFVEGSRNEKIAAAECCAQWLAQFHALAPPLGKPCEDDLSRIRHSTQHLISIDGRFAHKCKLILAQLMAAGPAPDQGEFRTCHGSYIPQHVVLTGRSTVVLDLDDYFLAHPSRDVAYFMVGIQRLAEKRLNSFHELDWVSEVFLSSYVRSSSGAVLARLPLARAAEYVHVAKKRAAANQSSEWRERAEVMLEEALLALQPAPLDGGGTRQKARPPGFGERAAGGNGL
jgi:aminoglycoside phosphotransferase (APT) family kinase protein